MADQKPNPFKAMMAARPNAPLVEAEPVDENSVPPEPTNQRSPRKKTASTSKATATQALPSEPANPPTQQSASGSEITSEPAKRGRGRPPGGKRTDDKWIPRTYYVERNNDIDCEIELARLRAHGIELDKSDLVNALLSAWVTFQRGENTAIQIDGISPRQKSEKTNF